MRSRHRRRQAPGTMSSHHVIVVRLEVDRDSDPISGTLSAAGQETRSFTGWLGLTDAIEEIRDAQAATQQAVLEAVEERD